MNPSIGPEELNHHLGAQRSNVCEDDNRLKEAASTLSLIINSTAGKLVKPLKF